ncbi:hypothetical protein [Devosia ginsengisoli]|uniref:phosphoribosyltransferase-like protein n=1 Tax=Devosia ginsengisoli TaxID=400770 RepID=UPI0026EA3284|nr:hypothetical protein [Devosia ginsengisoli]MCR6673941.1 hypothetical protein [Devosia ginsengisoli]
MPQSERAPAFQSRSEFDHIFQLHEKQPWTRQKHDELYSLLSECQNLEEQLLVLGLLSRYENFDEDRVNDTLAYLRDTVIDEWKLDSENTIVVALHKKSSPGSAQATLHSFKNKFAGSAWSAKNFVAFAKPAIEVTKSNSNVVFIDDFVGTGKQFSDNFDWYKSELDKAGVVGVSFYLVSLCIMDQAINRLVARNVVHSAGIYMKKALSDTCAGSELSAAHAMMKSIEKNLGWNAAAQQQKYTLGYGQSEALFRNMENNSPNNNFPIFWWSRRVGGGGRRTMQARL